MVLERRPQGAVSHEVRRRGQGASRGASQIKYCDFEITLMIYMKSVKIFTAVNSKIINIQLKIKNIVFNQIF